MISVGKEVEVQGFGRVTVEEVKGNLYKGTNTSGVTIRFCEEDLCLNQATESNLSDTLDSAAQELQNLLDKVQNLEEAVQQKDQELSEVREENYDLESQIGDLQSELSDMEDSRDNWESQADDFENERDSIQSEYDILEEEHQKTLAELAEVKEKLNSGLFKKLFG